MLDYIIKDLFSVFRYLPYGIVAGIIVAVLLSAVNETRLKYNKKPIPIAAVTCYVMYLVIIIFITFLSRENGSRNVKIDLSFFSTWGINDRNNALVIENILLFVPYGFVCPWAIKSARKFISCTLFGLLTSTCIETMQLITGRGYFQIDDILTNMIGTIIGYIFFRCIFRGEHKTAKRARFMYMILAILIIMTVAARVPELAGNTIRDENVLSEKIAWFVVNKSVDWINIEFESSEISVIIRYIVPHLRMTAHFFEYAAITVIIGFGYHLMNRKRAKVVNYFYAVNTCGIIAILNEMLQSYVFHRNGSVMYVIVDICGAVFGGFIYIFLNELFSYLRVE